MVSSALLLLFNLVHKSQYLSSRAHCNQRYRLYSFTINLVVYIIVEVSYFHYYNKVLGGYHFFERFSKFSVLNEIAMYQFRLGFVSTPRLYLCIKLINKEVLYQLSSAACVS